MMHRWSYPVLLGAAAVLAGCSTGPKVVEGQVQSFSTLATVPTPATYRLVRLPSQQVPPFDPIAALAEQALARAGLQRNDAAPRLIAQIGVQADRVARSDALAPYGGYAGYGGYGGYGRWGSPFGWGAWYGSGRGLGIGFGGLWNVYEPSPLHRRSVSITLRDATTQAVVYETSAVHEDVWVSDPGVFGVLFDAALNGFPRPPQGPREVRLPMPSLQPAPHPLPPPAPQPVPQLAR